MNDLEKMQKILILNADNIDKSFENIIDIYLRVYQEDFNLERLFNFINNISNKFLQEKITSITHNIKIAKEYATYIELYLKGDMYKTKEATIEALPLQIKHAEKVVKLLNE